MMMAECDWAILCDYAFLDVARKTCIIGIFDRIFAPAVPTALHHSSLAMKILGNPNESVNFRIEVVRPSGGQLAGVGGNVVIAESGSADIQLNFAGLALPDYGPYAVNIYVHDELSKSTTFVVVQVPPPAPPQNNQS
jgi:hypothetical protein